MEVDMKHSITTGTAQHSHSDSHYPVYLQRPSRSEQTRHNSKWGSFGPELIRPASDVPAELSVRITGRAPHDLSRTSLCVIDLLLRGDLSRLRSAEVADHLHVSPTTLRRRLRADHTNYQHILDHVRQYRCAQLLDKRWLPGKSVAWELGYAEVNSFYRAFRRWTGQNYSDLKALYI